MTTTLRRYAGITLHLFATSEAAIKDVFEAVRELRFQMELQQDGALLRSFLRQEAPSVVVVEQEAVLTAGIELTELVISSPYTQFVVVAARPEIELCIELMSLGVAAYLSLPVDPQELRGVLGRCFEREAKPARAKLEASDEFQFDGIVGRSQAMRVAVERMRRVSPTDIAILLLGENGTGKELAARAVHVNSELAKGPFIAVHLGAVPESLVESELFGHVKGAFTDAKSDRVGKIEAAEGGTLFLDEVGDIPAETQIKLLRVLETREYTRVGDNRVRRCRFRLVTATNRDLVAMCAQGLFREDLYYRIKGLEVRLPPLRERLEDIPLFLEAFVAEFNERYPSRRIIEVPAATVEAFKADEWRGNIRELRNRVLEYSVLSDDGVLRHGDMPVALTSGASDDAVGRLVDEGRSLDEYKSLIIAAALEQNGGNRKKTARQLEIPERTFYRMLDRFGLK